MFHVHKILYATDFSSYSNQAYFHAVALSEQHGAALTILHVYAPGIDSGSLEDSQSQLQDVHPSNPKIPVCHVLLQGDPASEIVRYAVDNGIDLIVMGTHGRTGVDRLLMGSVAERVMRDVPCSVLVVKMPKGHAHSDQPTVQIVFKECR